MMPQIKKLVVSVENCSTESTFVTSGEIHDVLEWHVQANPQALMTNFVDTFFPVLDVPSVHWVFSREAGQALTPTRRLGNVCSVR